VSFTQEALCEALQQRRLLCESVQVSHQKALLKAKPFSFANSFANNWTVKLGNNLLFDLAGLNAIANTLKSYQGSASTLNFKLQLSAEALRDYYSHNAYLKNGFVELPITAINTDKISNKNKTNETLLICLNELTTDINYPLSLATPDINRTPLALLLPYSCDHDLLFANQIALFSSLNHALRRSPLSWINALLMRRKISLSKRISLSFKKISPHADIHPSAIIEGSLIGKGCRIGAHCVVRYSQLGENVVLHDGAKVEYSVVDNNSWLMHDLVLYRSLTEAHVFLIHGPYQFSYFQKQSAAFANIMMDYRPDNKPIRIKTPAGIKNYQGRFLGALLEEKARVFGGTLTAPGITIPHGKEIYCNADAVTTPKKIKDGKQ